LPANNSLITGQSKTVQVTQRYVTTNSDNYKIYLTAVLCNVDVLYFTEMKKYSFKSRGPSLL